MSAKRKTDEGSEGAEVDALAPDMEKVPAEFSLKALLGDAGQKMEEASKRKIGLQERIAKNREAIQRIETLIRNLQAKAQQESGAAFVAAVVRPIQAVLTEMFPNAQVEISGPFGLASATVLTVSRKGANNVAKLKGEQTKSITFVPMADGKLGVRNVHESTGEYPPGSLGDLNGLNFEVREVPVENTIQFLLEWLK